MPAVYIDEAGDVRSVNSGRVIAPAGTTAREARVRAALWAATADALVAAGPTPPTPITSAPSYARTVPQTLRTLTAIDVGRITAETAAALDAITQEDPTCL